MPAYRFCRTDDIPHLTDALNTCYVVHFAGEKALSVTDFKREIRELNVWSSSCMTATEDGRPISVVTGAKREHETLIHRIGTHPDFQRHGHARHLLESLSHKLSVLGPPKIVAEVPDDLSDVRDLFEAVGYEAEGRFADFTLSKPLPPLSPAEYVDRIELEDVLGHEAMAPGVLRSWQRAPETLCSRKDQLHGLVSTSHSGERSYALFRDLTLEGRREIVAIGGGTMLTGGERDAPASLARVIRAASHAGSLIVTIPRISSAEIAWPVLEALGFERQRTYTRYAEYPGSHLH
jgi:GNAT superfamily N-acetyltransferase